MYVWFRKFPLEKGCNVPKTRMHYSRMRTARSSSRLRGGVCLSACWDTPSLGLGLDIHPGSGLWDTPSQTPQPPPPRCGPGNPPSQTPQPPPPSVWAWTPPSQTPQLPPPPGVGLETLLPTRPLNFPSGRGPGDPPLARPLNLPPGCGPGDPPCGQTSWHTLLKILPCPNIVAGGKDKNVNTCAYLMYKCRA